MTAWIGIDPGGRDTGVIALDRARGQAPRLISHETVTRTVDEDTVDQTRGVQVGPRYLAEVLDAVDRAIGTATAVTGGAPRVAVETVVLYGDGDTAEYEALAGDEHRALIASRELAQFWRKVTDPVPVPAVEPETRRNQRCWICEERHTCTRTPQGWECPTCQTIT